MATKINTHNFPTPQESYIVPGTQKIGDTSLYTKYILIYLFFLIFC